jgi:hypothetical protein
MFQLMMSELMYFYLFYLNAVVAVIAIYTFIPTPWVVDDLDLYYQCHA